MLAGVKKRIAHHHQAYVSECHPGLRAGITDFLKRILCFILRIPCKMFATHWLACSEAAAINGWGKNSVKKGEVIILPNAIDPERFKFDEKARKEIRARYGIKDDDFVIGHVGRFYPQKNHDFLIDVFYEVHKQKPSAKLLLLGDGPLQEKIRKKVKDLGIADSIIFAGLQKGPAPFYSAMDVFAFPSLWEGLGIVLLEAQYNGLPCVVSEVVPKEAEISDGITSMDLNTSVQEWAKDVISLSRMRNYVKCVKSQFDINVAFPKLQMLYKG